MNSIEQAIQNAVQSAKMEGLDPTDKDIDLIRKYVNNKITKEQFIQTILNEVRGNEE